MALYQLTDRSGNKIQVEGPSGATKEQVVSIYNRTMAERRREPERRFRAGLENYYDTQTNIAEQTARSRKPRWATILVKFQKVLLAALRG